MEKVSWIELGKFSLDWKFGLILLAWLEWI
jgi:hypothetical protein